MSLLKNSTTKTKSKSEPAGRTKKYRLATAVVKEAQREIKEYYATTAPVQEQSR